MDPRVARTVFALAVGAMAATFSWAVSDPRYSDFSHLAHAARLFLSGGDPWAAVGPGRAIAWPYPLYYPAPALLLVWPFAVIGDLGGPVFVGASCAAFAYALTGQPHHGPWLAFGSPAFLAVAVHQQWGAWMAAAAAMPMWFGVMFAAKPTIGAAMWTRRLRWRALAVPALLAAGSLLVMPSWPVRWLAAAHGGVHPMPVLQLAGGGPLLLLAWLRWRDPDARLLGALSLVPQTIAPHECFVLFLLCRKWWEGVILTLLIGVAYTVAMSLKAGHAGPSFTTGGQEYIAQQMAANGPVFTALVYLPCLAAVLLRRPLRRHAVDVNGARGNVAGTE